MNVQRVVSHAVKELRRAGTRERARGAAAYFKAYERVKFFGVDAPSIRRIASRLLKEEGRGWTLAQAIGFADSMLARPELEAKALGACVLGKFQAEFVPSMLPRAKRWFARDCTDWASTDTLCGELLSPLVVAHRDLVPKLRSWRTSPHLYVRRASAVGLLRLAREGHALDDAYDAALVLGAADHHLLHKAAGWLLREAGTTDMNRLERYLRKNGPLLSRTTISYALERFPAGKRKVLLEATRRPTTT
jgi:3-methyladenine DNA glycosylase AlkD